MLDFGATILTWQSLTMAAVLIVLSVVIALRLGAAGQAIRTAEDMDVDLDDTRRPAAARTSPGEWLERSAILPTFVGCSPCSGWSTSSSTSRSSP